jgi:hypothetical protein
MAMAGVDRFLSPAEIEAICAHYTAPKTASMDVMHYVQFLADVDEIFTKPVSCCCSWPWLAVLVALRACTAGGTTC